MRHEIIKNVGHAVTKARDVEDAVPYSIPIPCGQALNYKL
jgi:hypothetical protein